MGKTIINYKVSSGSLTLTSDSPRELIDEFLDVAERVNKKRSFLFVSKVLGRHVPVAPAIMRKSMNMLAAKIPRNLPGPIIVFGMAETAVGLAAGVHQYLAGSRGDVLLMLSTRHRVHADLLCEFEEEHSHATQHFVYKPDDPHCLRLLNEAKTLIVVDDEATTGKTFANAISRLEKAIGRELNLATVTLTDWSDNNAAKLLNRDIHNISLIDGKWTWTPALADVKEDDHIQHPAENAVVLDATQYWGRKGATIHQRYLGQHISVKKGERILVLGTGEFVYQPFLMAEALEALGAKVLFGATSRSPISEGAVIRRKMCFADNYRLGIRNYLYNFEAEAYDRIFLCIESRKEFVDDAFSSINNLEIVSDVI